ncbi:hypothetical protein Hanom_Chr10g00942951 [Helianthus anomalus]
MLNDYEEGEVRSSEPNQPVPEVVSQQSPVSQPNPEFGKPSEDVRLVYEESVHGLHGEHSFPKESVNKVNKVGTVELAAGKSNGGSQYQDVREDPLVDPVHQDGPTPSVGLGKRSRAHRSPPSSGSMQGPPTRGFYQNPDNEDFSFDLNRPSVETTSVCEVAAGEDILVNQAHIPEKVSSQPVQPRQSTVGRRFALLQRLDTRWGSI